MFEFAVIFLNCLSTAPILVELTKLFNNSRLYITDLVLIPASFIEKMHDFV